MQQFRHLFSPIQIGSMTVKNRISTSAHATFFYNLATSLPTDREIAYYEAKAKGGVGMIVTRLTNIRPAKNSLRDPEAIPWYKKFAGAIHRHEAKLVVQLAHHGGQGGLLNPPPSPDGPSVGPVLNFRTHPYMARELTTKEIKEIIGEFAYAANVCREAGVDGVEIHGAHGYLLDEFLSPAFNRRQDEYGGSLENRLRLTQEVVDAVRRAVGRDYVVGLRLNGDQFVEGGVDFELAKSYASRLSGQGQLDFLSISCGTYASTEVVVDPMYFPLNSFVYLAAGIKEVVDIPVLARGRIVDPVQAEEILANNQADMVVMTRASIADPEFPKKAEEGRLDAIRKCLGCNERCWGTFSDIWQLFTTGMGCTMNPVVGRETLSGWLEFQPAAKAKRVMVIGGGPAGLEAARVAAERGHLVSLYERNPELGGQVLIAAKAPGRDGFLDLPRYYSHELKRLKVDVHLGVEVTADMVVKNKPDAVIVATGSVSYIPEIPGAEQQNVVEARDIFTGKRTVGDSIVVMDGEWRIRALSLADLLASQGKHVEILCEEYYFGLLLEINTRKVIVRRVLQNGVTLTPLSRIKKISGNSVVVENVLTGKQRVIEGVDSIVFAYGGRADDALYQSLRGRARELYAVGDCFGGSLVADAILAGATVARQL
jgi:2,4-dienoyl-CoA reductase-like NADH-dependent reductase (Old Yellow Enzyme family)/thioredoxin reductase